MPPCASGPLFTVSRPSRNGSACATAGAGKRVSAAAAPAALPANRVRRLTLRVLGISSSLYSPLHPPRTGEPLRHSFLIAAGAALAAIIGEADRAVKAAIVAF